MIPMVATPTAVPLWILATRDEPITKEEIIQAIDDLYDRLLDLRRMAERLRAGEGSDHDEPGRC